MTPEGLPEIVLGVSAVLIVWALMAVAFNQYAERHNAEVALIGTRGG